MLVDRSQSGVGVETVPARGPKPQEGELRVRVIARPSHPSRDARRRGFIVVRVLAEVSTGLALGIFELRACQPAAIRRVIPATQLISLLVLQRQLIAPNAARTAQAQAIGEPIDQVVVGPGDPLDSRAKNKIARVTSYV